jgi:hypothetical protein
MRKGSLHSPTVSVAAHSPTVVGATLGPSVSTMRSKQLDADRGSHGAQRVAIVRLVRDDDLRPESWAAGVDQLLKNRLDELGLADRGRCANGSERDAFSAHEEFGFRALPALREANSFAPFFATRKVASAYVSFRSSRPRSSRTPSSASHAPRQIPFSSHSRRRRQQVTPLGNGGGRSLQRAPDLSTQMIPSRHSRLPRHGRPRLSRRVFGVGNKGLSIDHCSSVRMLKRRFAIPQRKPWFRQKYKYHDCIYL